MILQGSIEYFSRFLDLIWQWVIIEDLDLDLDLTFIYFYVSGVICPELMFTTINEVKSVGIGWN